MQSAQEEMEWRCGRTKTLCRSKGSNQDTTGGPLSLYVHVSYEKNQTLQLLSPGLRRRRRKYISVTPKLLLRAVRWNSYML